VRRALPLGLLMLVGVLPSAWATDSARVLTVTEKLASHRQPPSCPQDQAVCYADIESTLHIVPDLTPLLGSGIKPVPTLDASGLAPRRQALLAALQSLERSLALSRQIVELVRAGDSASLPHQAELSAQFNAEEQNLVNALKSYVTDNAAYFKLSATPSKREINSVLGNAFPLGGATNRWIAAELQRIDQLSADVAAAVRARSELLVRLGAFRTRPGAERVALHLPGYDNIPAGDLTPFERIRFDISAEDQKKLTEETQFNTDVIARITALRAEVQKDGGALQALVSEAETFADALQKKLAAAAADLQASSAGLTPGFTNLRTSIDGLNQAVAGLEKNVAGLQASLSGTPQGTDANRPDLVLLQILGQLAPLADGKPFADILAQAKKVRDSATALKSQITAAPAAVRQQLTKALEGVIEAAAVDSGPLSSLASLLKTDGPQKMATKAEDLGAILGLQVGDAKRFDLAGDTVQATDLEILRSAPARGDTIELVLEVRRKPAAGAALVPPAPPAPPAPDDRPLYEERKAIRVDVYGWSTGVATGIGFIKSKKDDLSNFKPSPIAVWRIGFRPRPDDSGVRRWLGGIRPGFGIHVATPDLDPNASVETGAGVAIHLFSDLVQIGYGWDLSVKKDRSYWYLGIGLFDLLRGK
jgi:hypothetical protein